MGQGEAAGGAGLLGLLPVAAMAVMAYFLFVAPQQASRKKYQAMIDALKENDRVVTTGGIHGVVTGVQRDQGRLTLRIDDQTGARVRVSLWAIDSLVTDEKAAP